LMRSITYLEPSPSVMASMLAGSKDSSPDPAAAISTKNFWRSVKGMRPSKAGSVWGAIVRCSGGVGIAVGQSVRGVSRVNSWSNVAAHSVRRVRAGWSGAKILRTVAGMLEWQKAAPVPG